MDDLLESVPQELKARFKEIVSVTDRFCDDRLNDEYRELCRSMAVELCQPDTPVASGKASGWAAGIVYAIGWANFLTDPAQVPHATALEIARGCGVSEATMHSRARKLKQGFGLDRFDLNWSLPSQQGNNPYLQIAVGMRAAGFIPPVIEMDSEDGVTFVHAPDDLELADMLRQLVESGDLPLDVDWGLEAGVLPGDLPDDDVLGFRITEVLPFDGRTDRPKGK